MAGVKVVAQKISLPKLGDKRAGTKQLKQAPQKAASAAKSTQKKAPSVQKSVQKQASNLLKAINKPAGYRKYEGDALWLPSTTRPDWLDGTLPGDRGFDPLGLAKKQEYLQVDIDEQDIDAQQNKKGDVIGKFVEQPGLTTAKTLVPYGEVFGLQRFRECELIHGRWCMLACLGCIVAEATTGVSWVDAGKVELEQPQYLGFDLPFSIYQVSWIEAILVGGAEIYRSSETDTEKRLYPGGYFDPLNFASDPDRTFRLKEAEIKHARLAMVAFFGYGTQALLFGEGVGGSLAKFTNTF